MAKMSNEMLVKTLLHAIHMNEGLRDIWQDKANTSDNKLDKALATMMVIHYEDEIEKDRKLLTEIKGGSDGLDTD